MFFQNIAVLFLSVVSRW